MRRGSQARRKDAMDEQDLQHRLSRSSTQWSLLLEAHHGDPGAVTAAQRELMQRYAGAAYRYVAGIVRDADVADDLAQEFAVRFLRGDFRSVDPRRGRFRDFMRMALRHLVVDYHRRRQARPAPAPVEELQVAAPEGAEADFDRDFLDSWRRELLQRAWEPLARSERETQLPPHTVLRFRADHPEMRSA